MAQDQDKSNHRSSRPTAHVDYAGSQAKTDPEEIRLVRKLDACIMPVLCLMYFFHNVDRSSLAQARLNHIEHDLDMHGTEFNTAVSILMVGYILMQIPTNMLITRVRPSAYLAGVMLVWSVLSACTGLVHSYGALVACRFLLGFCEAPFWPGAAYLLAQFYTRKELAARLAILFSATLTGIGFVNLIALGIFKGLDGKRGIEGWRWLYFIDGAASGLVAVCSYWLLPDTHETTWWLSERERQLEGERMRRDRLDEARDTESVWTAVRQALSDKRTWLFCALGHISNVPLTFNYFLPTVISALGFSDQKAMLLACPPYICAALAGIVVAWSSGRFHERSWHITGCLCVAGLGFVAAAATLNPAGRYVACFVFPVAGYSTIPLVTSWGAATLSQTPEKKAR
ncbi:major facilitator superfamily domain-containing protein [Apiospora marii]|uniref:Major facilitator superfamily domain-containing protein n=1 Tax=Apiospora marii TaxID=335849 RepID=A0ABR1R727_9PEZI